MALLNVDKLSVHFGDESAPFRAVDRISYSVKQGEVVGIVGESGSGKSVSSLAIMGLIDYPGRVMAEKLEFNGQDLQLFFKHRRNSFAPALLPALCRQRCQLPQPRLVFPEDGIRQTHHEGEHG